MRYALIILGILNLSMVLVLPAFAMAADAATVRAIDSTYDRLGEDNAYSDEEYELFSELRDLRFQQMGALAIIFGGQGIVLFLLGFVPKSSASQSVSSTDERNGSAMKVPIE